MVPACLQALHLTGQAQYAEAMERTLHSAFLRTWRFADFASLVSPGIAGEAAYRVWFRQPTLDR